MSLHADLIAALEAENEQLRDRVCALEELNGLRLEAPLVLGLTTKEAKIFGFLSTREMATKPALMTLLYSDRPNEEPDIKIVDVFVCKMRAKLEPFGIEITTMWGTGYAMTPASKAKAEALRHVGPAA